MRKATAAARQPNLSEQVGFDAPEVWNSLLSGLPYNATQDERTLRAVQHAQQLANYPAFTRPRQNLPPELVREDIGNRMMTGAVVMMGYEMLAQKNGNLQVREGTLPVDRHWLIEGKVEGKSIMQELLDEFCEQGDYATRREAIGGLNTAINRAERMILGGFDHLSRAQIIALQVSNYKMIAGLLAEHMAKEALRVNGFPLTTMASLDSDVHFATDIVVRRTPADYVALQIKSPKNEAFCLDTSAFPVRANIPLLPHSPNPKFEMEEQDLSHLVNWAEQQLH